MSEVGIVKWYSIAKGYGFIRREPGAGDAGTETGATGESASADSEGADIFVHYSDLATTALNEGERVCFDIVSSPKGLKARNVALANGPNC